MTDQASPDVAGPHFKTIGVVGLGTMGAGIAEVFARNGFSVVGVEQNDEAAGPGPPAPRALHRPRGASARSSPRPRQAELLGRITFTTTMKDLHEADFVVEAVVESLEIKKDDLPRARGHRRTRRDPRHQHVEPQRHRDLDRQRPPGPGDRRALLQPRAGAEPRRDHPDRRHRAAGARGRHRTGRGARQEPRRLRRQGRLHRQHPAVRLPQPRGGDVSRASSPPARTSTPRCASAAATRWARCSCST